MYAAFFNPKSPRRFCYRFIFFPPEMLEMWSRKVAAVEPRVPRDTACGSGLYRLCDGFTHTEERGVRGRENACENIE